MVKDICSINFSFHQLEMADAGLLRLHTHLEWMKEYLTYNETLRTGEYNFMDKIFISEVNHSIKLLEQYYEKMLYRDVNQFSILNFLNFDFNRVSLGDKVQLLRADELQRQV